jgi:hypothetical protein
MSLKLFIKNQKDLYQVQEKKIIQRILKFLKKLFKMKKINLYLIHLFLILICKWKISKSKKFMIIGEKNLLSLPNIFQHLKNPPLFMKIMKTLSYYIFLNKI